VVVRAGVYKLEVVCGEYLYGDDEDECEDDLQRDADYLVGFAAGVV
jgi:hypothetical protein